MSDAIISVENLGKCYRLSHQAGGRQRYVALRDVLAEKARNLFRSRKSKAGSQTSNLRSPTSEDFWALKNVSFEIKRGEVVGIIGRNGAGKSTLLKILSRITEPTEGRVTLRGRVASLLEVGTGFHPELTGRENIFLNGAILGMSRAEIRKKFDEIVAFAEVEKFLDTPVKRYSSGMYVRLAFAVAAHLEPEILIVDEVLAVGDAEFQKKCLGKMQDVSKGGRTVLFVSHNMAAVRALCNTGMVMRSGQLELVAATDKAIEHYNTHAKLNDTAKSRRMTVHAKTEGVMHGSGQSAVVLSLDVELRGVLRNPRLGIGLNAADGSRVATLFTETSKILQSLKTGEIIRFNLRTEPVRLQPGRLSLKIALAEDGVDIEVLEDAIEIVIPEYQAFTFPPRSQPRGVIYINQSITEYA